MSPDDLMTYAGGVLLLFVHVIPWLSRNSQPMTHNPSKLAFLLSASQVLPHYLIVSAMPEESALFPLLGDDLNQILPNFALFYALGLVSMYAGIAFFARPSRSVKWAKIRYVPNYYAACGFSFATYLLSMYLIAESTGGVANFIQNAGNQSEFQVGTGVFYILKVPAAYLSILFLSTQHARTGRPNVIFLFLFILLIVGIESTLGSRRTPIQLIIFSVIAIHMIKPSMKLFSISNLVLASLCATIFVGLLSVRDQVSNYEQQRGLYAYLVNFSYNDIYIFVLHHFSNSELWNGKIFLDIPYRLMGDSSGLPPPSLDEGVYIYNLFIGRAVEPPLPLELMAHNSWPPRTFGNGYLNFGLIGIVIFFFIQGAITGKAFQLMKDSGHNPMWMFLYLLIVFSFQISNLKITELLIVLAGLVVILGPLLLFEKLTLDPGRAAGGARHG